MEKHSFGQVGSVVMQQEMLSSFGPIIFHGEGVLT